jgi:hypothetical protein
MIIAGPAQGVRNGLDSGGAFHLNIRLQGWSWRKERVRSDSNLTVVLVPFLCIGQFYEVVRGKWVQSQASQERSLEVVPRAALHTHTKIGRRFPTMSNGDVCRIASPNANIVSPLLIFY